MSRTKNKYSVYELGGFGKSLLGYADTKRQAVNLAKARHDKFGHPVEVWNRFDQRTVYSQKRKQPKVSRIKMYGQSGQVLLQLEDGPKRYAELLKRSRLSEKEFSTALFRLRKRGLVERPSRGLYRKTPKAVRYV
jgi:predicted Rossmann fold nucleotide-binding protein DprA/Smf involved in DNA uptake